MSFSSESLTQICVGTAGQLQWNCWRNLYDNELGEVYAEEFYPHSPDITQVIYNTQSPINFDNFMGGRISGFISVPQSDSVIFNLTGDDVTRFYLSDGPDPANLKLEAYADGWSNIEEHDKYPEQTSDSIWLQQGVYYYFELIYMEGSGGDHITLWWKTDNVNINDWNIISGMFLNDVGCLPAACPERGTICDDGNGDTMNDEEDGFCNCVGQDTTSNVCVGDRKEVWMYAYDNIPGSTLNDLYGDPDYPGMPDRGANLETFGIPWSNVNDSTGTLIQAYLSVPVTGNYKFNVTGNNETIFFLSSDDDPANKQAHQIFVVGSTDPTEHDKYIFQSTANINLVKGQYYYVELNHKESAYSEHFSVFWQTPFTEPDQWKRIPDFYFYDYECEIACIPQGYPCDDGDAFTNNDMYDDNCTCVGTPCNGPDCDDPMASYVPFAKCGLTDEFDNRNDINWLSCTRDENPNSMRDSSHWIKYDLGQEYRLWETHVWNYNGSGGETQGFENVAIDYSIDGTNWTELGIYNWPLAVGDDSYARFIGPNFGGIVARHVLITSLDDPLSEPCRGFGKMTFTSYECDTFGDPCDDNNPSTINDTINEFCVCVGEFNALNDCLIDHLTLGDTLIPTNNYSAIYTLNSSNLLEGSSDVKFIAGDEIDLLEGFEVPVSAVFETVIEPCPDPVQGDEAENLKSLSEELPKDYLKVLAIPDTDHQIIEFLLEGGGVADIQILDQNGQVLFQILHTELKFKGIYHKRIRTKKLGEGVYQVVYKAEGIKEIEKMVVLQDS